MVAQPPAQGGGMLQFLGVHIADQILWMLDDYPERVSAEIQFGGSGDDETSSINMRFANDILASLNMSNRMVGGMTTGIDFIEIIGSEGRIRADWRPNILHVRSDVVKAHQNPTTIRGGGGFRSKIDHKSILVGLDQKVTAL